MSLPLSLLIPAWYTFLDANGDPLANGSLHFYAAGTLTPQVVYGDADGNTSLGSIVTLNSAGQCSNSGSPTGVFISPTGYKMIELDSNAATVHTQDQIEDVGATFLATLGTFFSQGQKAATSPYTVTNDDLFISIAGGTVLLQPVADRTQPLTVQNTSTTTATAVTPDGTENINSIAAAFSLQAATASPNLPCVTLVPYAALGGYLIQSTAFVTP